MSHLQTALSASITNHLSLFNDTDCEVKESTQSIDGSQTESLIEVLQKKPHDKGIFSGDSCGYNGDVSESLSQRVSSRFSIAAEASSTSCFESVPIACSSILNRTSIENRFAMPKKPPLRQQNSSGQSKENDSSLLSHHLSPETSESISTMEAGLFDPPPNSCTEPKEESNVALQRDGACGSVADAELNAGKRGRKQSSKASDCKSDASATPKKGRQQGRPPVNRTKGPKESAGSKGANSGAQSIKIAEETSEKPTTSTNEKASTDGQSSEGSRAKSSDDYLKEAEEAWRDTRHRSFEIGI